ncbi:DNA damage-induced apoptosis suppressor protein isoform X2 [Centrocercus urophasianus]|uniref:DNA damage-induced apoptosis suppressor protein isoform X2 n=1 Tax=Centrocercus urophasianus TaxID=9002 RepID=UPI001C650569|nr:DNA damage-induced apoptosis suppressor protein isoform X2 [Centrocercus urophasianus]
MSSARRLLAASVISVQNSCFIYPACQSCLSRLILDSRRFNCLKCGCTGEAEEAGYRYRLSLKIADTNDLFDITVFGSCLDPFFGVTAGNLQRCIQDFNQLSGETNKAASPAVLVQAVETCFIGKRFIFGVKGFGSEDGACSAASSILQNCSRINRGTKNLTACQIFLPNAAVTGFTVISYFRRLLQSVKFRNNNNSSYLPDASSALIDESVSELSSLSVLSRNSCFVQSSGRESFLGSWQQSFSLTSSVAWVTAEDFPSVEVRKLFCSSSVKEGNKEEENELSSQPSQADRISATDKLERISSSKTECSLQNSSQLLENPLDFGSKIIYPKTNSGNYSCQEKSPKLLFYGRHTSASNCVNLTGASQADSMLWDELPFSESLNEFLARIEYKSFVTSPNLDVGKCGLLESSKLSINHNKSHPRQTPAAGALPEASGKFLPSAEKDSWESISFACLKASPNPLSDEVLQHNSFSSVLCSDDKECRASCFIPRSHLLTPSKSLQVTSETSASKRSRHSKEASAKVSKSACSFISPHCSAEHEETCLQRSKRATCVHSVQDSCLSGSENKENSSCIPNQIKDLTFTGAWDSGPATPSVIRRICGREIKPLTELRENAFKSINKREVIWNGGCPEGSYNASADLFDVNAGEGAKAAESLNKSSNSLIQEDPSTEKVTTPKLVLFPGDVSCNSSKQTSSLHRTPLAFRKHSTPVTCSFYDSDCNTFSAQDFVPYSESTPVAKPLQKLRPAGEHSPSVTVFTSENPTKIHSKRKRSRSSFQNTLLQQLTGRRVKRERLSSSKDIEGKSSVPQQFCNSQSPASVEEWIPPSANRRFKPTASLSIKPVSWHSQLSCEHADRNPISGSKENSEKDVCFRSERFSSVNTATVLATPVSAGIAKALFLSDTVLESCSSSEGKNLSSRANYSRVSMEGATGWSPELFFQAQSPIFHKSKQ